MCTEEVKVAVAGLKSDKAADPGGAVAEILKSGGEPVAEQWAHILTAVMQRPEEVPASWAMAYITPLYKGKGPRAEAGSYRPIANSDLTYKLLARVLHRRLLHKLEPQLLDEQFGFRPRRGVDDCVFSTKRLEEEFRQKGQPLYLAFLDITKAYDSVPREALFRVLEERYGVDARAVALLRALYKDMRGEVKVGQATSAPFAINTGVRQGCILSPLLFAVYLDFLLRSSLEECRALGVEWTYARDTLARACAVAAKTWTRCPFRRIIAWILYADDMVVWADSAERLQLLVTILAERLAACGLLLSATKSKVMVTGGATDAALPTPITINGEALEVVLHFRYLGTIISADGTDAEDLRQRIGRAWSSFYSLGNVLLERRVPLRRRAAILYTSVISVLVHGCEHWRMTERMETDLSTAAHGMLLGIMRLNCAQAAEQHMTRAEARARTGAKDILGLRERRVLRRGSKLMRMHRTAPSLPSILFAGQLDMLQHPPEGQDGRGRRRSSVGPRRGPARWEDQYTKLLKTCLALDDGQIAQLTDDVVKEEAYGKIEEKPLEMRAQAEARCPHCEIMQNDEASLADHIERRHAKAGGTKGNDNNSDPTSSGGSHGSTSASSGASSGGSGASHGGGTTDDSNEEHGGRGASQGDGGGSHGGDGGGNTTAQPLRRSLRLAARH